MKFVPTTLVGVLIVEPEPRRDDRGFLARTYCEREFAEAGLNTRWLQQNHTATLQKGSVRGMHWQAEPLPEVKLVRCLVGRVLDVVVDVRPKSPTFGRWHAEELSAENMRALYIPAGFAHGFQCLEERCELFYLMSEFYAPDLARGLRCDDPETGIRWPLPVSNLSTRDATLPGLREIT
jgi:dTDP-4-dehydrorhamnose 3,5-epimerase